MDKRFLTVEELSEYLGTPMPTLYTWTHQKKIPHLKLGRTLRFDRLEIDGWLESRRVAASSKALAVKR